MNSGHCMGEHLDGLEGIASTSISSKLRCFAVGWNDRIHHLPQLTLHSLPWQHRDFGPASFVKE